MADRHDLSLRRWAAALRRDRVRRRRFRVRLLLGLAGIAALGLTVIAPPRPLLVWNVSASAPTGLYWVAPWGTPRRGDMVVAWTPAPWRRLAAVRRYLPENVPLVKRVAAAGGDRVCEQGGAVTVNGRWAARRRSFDGAGRPMPAWHGCRTLGDGALFLLTDAPASFDGRYFGPTEAADIVGRASLLWAR